MPVVSGLNEQPATSSADDVSRGWIPHGTWPQPLVTVADWLRSRCSFLAPNQNLWKNVYTKYTGRRGMRELVSVKDLKSSNVMKPDAICECTVPGESRCPPCCPPVRHKEKHNGQLPSQWTGWFWSVGGSRAAAGNPRTEFIQERVI